MTIIIKLDDGPKKGVLCKLSSCCRVLQLWSLKVTISLYRKITKYGCTVWPVNDGLSRNLLETSGNLPETSAAGFRRFPDNPSLTDHTVD